MSDPSPPSTGGATGGKFGFLGRKVGPLPLGVWLVAALGIYLYMAHRANATGGGTTDPAGNVGTIDPATGYVYGSPQDQAALNAGSGGSGGGGSSDSGGSGATVAGQYPDNPSWARAAVNYLVARGIDDVAANEAIQQWLSSQQLTPEQQADVNLAIQGIGAPPQLPGPVGSQPPPIVTPPSGVVYATNPPTGLASSGATGNTVGLKWNATTNATGYTVRWGTTPAASDGNLSVGATAGTTVGGLKPLTLYYFTVQATPAKAGAAFASLSVRTAAGSSPPPRTGAGGSYNVAHGDTLSSIASKLHTTAAHLYSTNRTSIEAAARAHGHKTSDNGNLIFPGTTLKY
jgi:Fibronectin type III domain/LysM domain